MRKAIQRIRDDERGHVLVGVPSLVAGIGAVVLGIGAAADSDATAIIGGIILGAGIFVTVNKTDGHGRRAGNISGIRALFIDCDNQPMPERWHVQPDLMVSRDEFHWHAYWLCSDLSPNEFSTAQKRLISKYESDRAIHDVSRVMRVPGFLHQKSAPVLVNFEDMRS